MPNGQTQQQNIFKERIDFVIDILQKKLDRQTDSLTTLQTKVNYMLAFVSLLIAGYLTVLFDNKINFSCTPTFKTLSVAGFAGLIICAFLLLLAARNRKFYDPPDVETVYSQNAFNMSVDNLKNQVASDMKASFNKNLPQLNKTAKWLNYAMLVFLASLSIIAITALFLPQCAKISDMSDSSNSSQQSRPVPPSQNPGTEVNKWGNQPTHIQNINVPHAPVAPSHTAGTALPFGEQSSGGIKGKE